MQVVIRKIGNSKGVVLPKALLAQAGLDEAQQADIRVVDGCLVLSRPVAPPRAGWAEAAQTIAAHGEDALVLGEFGNAADEGLEW